MVYSAVKENPSLTLEQARNPNISLPKSNIVIFLDLEPEKARVQGRYDEKIYKREKIQKKVRELYLYIQQDKKEKIVIINTARDIEEVEAQVYKVYGII